jgi:hypothetical protein
MMKRGSPFCPGERPLFGASSSTPWQLVAIFDWRSPYLRNNHFIYRLSLTIRRLSLIFSRTWI